MTTDSDERLERRSTNGPLAVDAAPANLEIALAHVLQLGTYASVALIALGAGLLLAGGGSPLAGSPAFDLGAIPGDVAALRPSGFLWLGIVGVLATPGLRVGRALLGFARRGEQRMVAISASVLTVIAVGVIVGVMAR
jgi:uncharacterized membrane protein